MNISGYSTSSHLLAGRRSYKNNCGYKVRCAKSSGKPVKATVKIVKPKAKSGCFKAGQKQLVIGKALTLDQAILEEQRLEERALARSTMPKTQSEPLKSTLKDTLKELGMSF